MRFAKTQEDAAQAIRAGKAFLTTFTGRHRVVGLRPNMDCNVVTNNTGASVDQQGWAACIDQIEIDD